LFADAESELAACNNDATKSALHVIVIDEIDAVFRRRSSSEDSGEATRSSVVNQILSKLDGVKAIGNVLLIGMTNRKELLDDALLRPGRLEVQIEIPLPNKEGRREILDIHFNALRKRGRLSHPLCCAIDGVPLTALPSVNRPINGELSSDLMATQEIDEFANGNLDKYPRSWIKKVFHRTVGSLGVGLFDLAADSVTGGFSGADIAGLVRCAGSLALSRARTDGYGIDGLVITLDDVKQALREVRR
jgi:SpoVK/Ycf46/Vps4 family AAA+-type ATPase